MRHEPNRSVPTSALRGLNQAVRQSRRERRESGTQPAAAKEAAELIFSAGGSASPYVSGGVERCLRDIHAACQHVTLATPNYQMAGQAFLDLDMRSTLLLFMDDRS